jgi:hypothetical protein
MLSDLPGALDKALLRCRVGEPCRSRLVDAAGIEKPPAQSAGHQLLDLSGGMHNPADLSV